jgi:CRP-like cAMP-binding protein
LDVAGKAALSGELSFINLPEIFQILGGNNSTGSLYLRSEYAPAAGRIYFVKGNPINAIDGFQKGKEAIYALFGWAEGKFEFYEEKVNVGRAFSGNRMEIVLDALKMIDDGEIKRIGPESQDKKDEKSESSESDGQKKLPILKGPFIDYVFVVDEEEYRAGDQIVKEGGHGKWIWVIMEGTVNVTKEVSGKSITISRLGEGSFIGTFTSFLFKENIRSATVTAETDVRLGLLDNERLSTEYGGLTHGLKTMLLSLDRRLRHVTDLAVSISENGRPLEIPKDLRPIIKKGCTKERLFLITEGEAIVVRKNSKGNLPILTLGEGDFFGYVPFWEIGHEPRSASVYGSKDLKANKLKLEKLQVEYDNLSGTFKNLIDNVSSYISLSTKMLNNSNNKE